jgi:hypothetical protein
MGAALAKEGVIKSDDHGSPSRESRKDFLKHRLKESCCIYPAPVVEPIMSAPVMLLASTGADEVGYGGSFGAKQNGEHVLLQTL